jgi:hypothetical protein
VIQYSSNELQKKYLSLIEVECKNKEAEWQSYALMKDRILVSEKKPQIYGSQVTFNNAKQQYELFPLADPPHVDKRRESVGLPPLKDSWLNGESNLMWCRRNSGPGSGMVF